MTWQCAPEKMKLAINALQSLANLRLTCRKTSCGILWYSKLAIKRNSFCISNLLGCLVVRSRGGTSVLYKWCLIKCATSVLHTLVNVKNASFKNMCPVGKRLFCLTPTPSVFVGKCEKTLLSKTCALSESVFFVSRQPQACLLVNVKNVSFKTMCPVGKRLFCLTPTPSVFEDLPSWCWQANACLQAYA